MIVHFIGSRSKIQDHIVYYRAIEACIKDLGHTLATDWIEESYTLAKKGQLKKESKSWAEVDKENAAAVAQSDVVIAEVTSKSFFAGFQVAQAAAQKKPILILTRDKSAVAVSGLSTPTGFVKSVTYDDKTLESAVKDFLDENIIDTKDLRFNFFLDRPTYNYLRWKSSKTGKTKAEIVRALLQREMERED
jgi:hypothetical protein